MNKRSRKTKGISRRLIAWLLCCVCLIGAVPLSAIAIEADAASEVEIVTPAEPLEEVTVEPELTTTVTPAATALLNLEDTSLDIGSSNPEPETTMSSTAVPTMDSTAAPALDSTAAPAMDGTAAPTMDNTAAPTMDSTAAPTMDNTAAPTESPQTETTTSPTPEVMNTENEPGDVMFMDADVAPASIGGEENITLEIGETKTITSTVTDTSADSDHRESWTSSNEAVATVEYTANRQSGYKATSATVTGVAPGTATITHTYYTYTSGNWPWSSGEYTSHTETITVTVKSPVTYTVAFSTGTEAVTAPDPVPVSEGGTISDLPVLSWMDENGQLVKIFDGWYTDAALTQKFTSETVVNANTTLYAKWTDIYTVTYNIGEAADAGILVPDPVRVTAGQTIGSLPELTWKKEDGQFEQIFMGWYSDEAMTQEFTTATPVNADTTLYAKWVEPDAEGVYYVNFYSQDGGTVHLTLSAATGKTVVPAQGPTLVGKVFKGWSTTMQNESPAADLNAFDFTTAISDSGSLSEDGRTLNLYAWYANSVNVNFIANGGTAVPSQTIAEGDTATSGQTTRTGYTFRGWSTNKDEYEAFDFATPVNQDLTLYAFWDAQLVPVTIVYMKENPNDAEYSPAGRSEKVYAPAGSYVSIEKNENIRDTDETHAVRYSETMDGELSGYAQTAAGNGGNATIPDILDTYFQYERATNKRWVNPDGSTTILVYYNRARVTLTFNYDQSGTTASIDYQNLISEANRTKYAVSYTQNSTSSFTYSFTAKYGEDITAVWPQVAWVKDSEGNTPSYTESGWGGGTYTFYAWDKPNDNGAQSSNMYTLESDLFGSGLNIVDGKLVGTGKLTDLFTSVQKDWLIYARTTLPGETVDFVYGGKNYTIYKEACQLGYTGTGTFGYKALDGCTAISGEPKLTTTYPNRANGNMNISGLSVNEGSTLKAKFDATFPNKISSGENCQVLLYDRSTLSLNVWTNADNNSDPQKASYLYGDKIYNENTDLLKSLESSMVKAGYVFAGWYTSSEFTPGTEYKPDENSTITGNMNLYAKWEPNQFRAEYYLYMDDASPYAWQGFAEGGKIDDKLVPSAVQDSFLGWYWYQDGQLVPFDFTSAVGANHVDANGVLKLYAKWSGNNGKVSYLPGIGGDNATQEVVDDRDFAINEASVQMPQYTAVWADGSVPSNSSLTFVGWKAPNGRIYQPGRYVLVTRNLMQFEAQWSSDAVKLIYNANGGEGVNVTETWARNSNVSIWDNMDGTTPHFTREKYTLLGWDEDPNAVTPTYPLGQGSITLSKDTTTLYAIWKLNVAELTVQKTVSGNMYDANEEFTFTIAYDGKSESFTLRGNESKTFQVPVGAEVTVTEDLTKSNGYIPSIGADTTVTLTSTMQSDGIFKFTMPQENGKLVINNEKNVTVDTGISLETVPYILILAFVVVGAVLLIRRRRNRDDD